MATQKAEIENNNNIMYAFYGAMFQRVDKPQKALESLIPEIKESRKIDNQDLLIASLRDLSGSVPAKSFEEWFNSGTFDKTVGQ